MLTIGCIANVALEEGAMLPACSMRAKRSRAKPAPTLAVLYNVAMHAFDHIRIVLVETQHPGNIGGAARAMRTMGLSQLWLVAPQRFPDPQAEWRAAGGVDVLRAARVVPTLEHAIAECAFVVGTSTRQRRIPWPVASAPDAARRIVAEPNGRPIAVLFGRETSGLTNDELQRCHLHLQIDADASYPSLNLAMAVQVVAYELFRAAHDAPQPASSWDRQPATAAEIDAFLRHLEQMLVQVQFVDPDNPGQTMTRMRRLFARIRPDDTEVKMLRGVLTEIQRRLPRSS
jgi:tRNA (cytidine32/uridine32-2'-O)-methyltransferase